MATGIVDAINIHRGIGIGIRGTGVAVRMLKDLHVIMEYSATASPAMRDAIPRQGLLFFLTSPAIVIGANGNRYADEETDNSTMQPILLSANAVAKASRSVIEVYVTIFDPLSLYLLVTLSQKSLVIELATDNIIESAVEIAAATIDTYTNDARTGCARDMTQGATASLLPKNLVQERR